MSWLLALTVVVGYGQTSAQSIDAPVTGYSLTSWTAADGRAIGSVYVIVQDADNYLWLGTGGGLVRFDGARFTPWLWNNDIANESKPIGYMLSLEGADSLITLKHLEKAYQ